MNIIEIRSLSVYYIKFNNQHQIAFYWLFIEIDGNNTIRRKKVEIEKLFNYETLVTMKKALLLHVPTIKPHCQCAVNERPD